MTALTHAPYAYAAGNPLNLTDPSGLCGEGSWWSRNWKTPVIVAAIVALVVVAAFVIPAHIEAIGPVVAEVEVARLPRDIGANPALIPWRRRHDP